MSRPPLVGQDFNRETRFLGGKDCDFGNSISDDTKITFGV